MTTLDASIVIHWTEDDRPTVEALDLLRRGLAAAGLRVQEYDDGIMADGLLPKVRAAAFVLRDQGFRPVITMGEA